jgi:Tripartite tricarboxylate transporter TctA family
VGNVILLVLNLPLVGIWVKLLAIPRPLLYAGILIFATLGAYGLRNSWFDLLLLYVIGLIGFLMRRYDNLPVWGREEVKYRLVIPAIWILRVSACAGACRKLIAEI